MFPASSMEYTVFINEKVEESQSKEIKSAEADANSVCSLHGVIWNVAH